MRLRERDEPLSDRAERELDAVDRALAGREVDPALAGWEELTTLLAEERPEPAPGWSEELDRSVAAGFREEDGDARSGAFAWLDGVRPMKLLVPAGAVATAAVVVVVGVSNFGGGTDDDGISGSAPMMAQEAAEDEAPTPESGVTSSAGAGAAAPPAPAGAAGGSAGDQFSDRESTTDELPVTPSASTASRTDGRGGEIAPGTGKRRVDRDVTLTLSTRPEEVRDTTDEAIAITQSAGGIVSSSRVSEEGRQATATLQLVIPTRELDPTLDRLTELANVDSLSEASEDITKPFVSAQDRLEDAEAQRVELLEALGNAETAAEAEAIRLQLDDLRREISVAESQFEKVARQARLAEVSLTIQGDPSAEARDDDGRTIGDWLDDAVSVLRDVAGVLLISAAILVPLGILLAIAWFAVTAIRRRRRESALDG